jgi:gas vesicle protein
MNNNNIGRDVGFFFAGLLIGGAVAALLTPYSGPRTRRMVRHKLEEGADQLAEKAGEIRDEAAYLFSRGKQMATRAEKIVTKAATSISG